MKKWVFGIIIIIIIIVIIIAVSLGGSKSKVIVTSVAVSRGDISETATAVGSIVPESTTTVKSQLEGNVSHIYYDSGKYVKKGEILLKLSPNPDPLKIAQYISLVDQYKALVKSDKEQIKNLKNLVAKGIIKKNSSDYITAVAKLKTDQAQLDFNNQNLEILRKGKAIIGGESMGSEIKSPLSGYILQRNVDIGDPVIPMSSFQSATVLYTIADLDRPIFQGTVDEIDAGKIKLGMPVEIVIGALPGVKLTGKLTTFSLQSDNQNALINQKNGMSSLTSSTMSSSQSPFNVGFQVKVQDFKLPKGVQLRSGYSATAEINIRTLKNILVLPERALVFQNSKVYVYIKSDKSDKNYDQKAPYKLNEIKIGISDGMKVQILSGVKEGEGVYILDSAEAAKAAKAQSGAK